MKLEAALQAFQVSVRGLIALDVGASTGGFSDCLLKHGAVKIYAVEVGHGQLAHQLQNDDRVHLFEKTDIRQLTHLPEQVDLVVVDVSFISLRLILPALPRFLRSDEPGIIALIKPQFEAGPGKINRQGVIKDKELRQQVVDNLVSWTQQQGWQVVGTMASPIQGGDGNQEYLVRIRPTL